MVKRIFALLCMAAMVVSLVGCGGSGTAAAALDQGEAAAPEDAAPAVEQPAMEAADPAAESTAAEDDPISLDELSADGKFYSDFDSYAELLEHVGQVNAQTAEEGIVSKC